MTVRAEDWIAYSATVAHNYVWQLGVATRYEYDDIEQIAMVGLMRAVRSYDQERGAFKPYLVRRVIGEVLDFFREEDLLSRRDREKVRDGAADAPVEPVLCSFEPFDEADLGLHDTLADPFAPDPATSWVFDADLDVLLARLPERERMVLTLWIREGVNQDKIGELLGVTGGRVCQIADQACKRLRNAYDWSQAA